MIYKNLHQLTGNLGADANLQVTAQGRRVLHLRVATEYTVQYKGKATKTVTWHDVTLWGPLAERAATWRKGDLVHVEGPVFERESKPSDGSRPRKHRELYADIAYRVVLPGEDAERPAEAASPPAAESPQSIYPDPGSRRDWLL
jgi:single-stranded DNA-binding protein